MEGFAAFTDANVGADLDIGPASIKGFDIHPYEWVAVGGIVATGGAVLYALVYGLSSLFKRRK